MAAVKKEPSGAWRTYRTRFLIQAMQLEEAMSFTDALGREHHGRKGDYLVESFEGMRSIAPRRVFEDVYVAITAAERRAASIAASQRRRKVPAETIHQQMALLDGSQPEIQVTAGSSEAESRPPKKKVQRAAKGRPGASSFSRSSRTG